MANTQLVGVLDQGQEIDLEMDERGWIIDVEGKIGHGKPGDRFQLWAGHVPVLTHRETGMPVLVLRLIPVSESRKARWRAKKSLEAFKKSVERLEAVSEA